jgi:hypothetical protein
MNIHHESVLRPGPLGQRTRKFPGQQRTCVENDFARIPDKSAILEQVQQFFPSNPAPVFVPDFASLGGGVRRHWLPGIFD